MCVCVCVCVRACARVCVRVCQHCMHAPRSFSCLEASTDDADSGRGEWTRLRVALSRRRPSSSRLVLPGASTSTKRLLLLQTAALSCVAPRAHRHTWSDYIVRDGAIRIPSTGGAAHVTQQRKHATRSRRLKSHNQLIPRVPCSQDEHTRVSQENLHPPPPPLSRNAQMSVTNS